MNKRILELAEQCYVKTGSEYTDHFAYWKFAELIVQECASIFEGVYTDQQRPERIDTRIKQHFGVEE